MSNSPHTAPEERDPASSGLQAANVASAAQNGKEAARVVPEPQEGVVWCYLFVHRAGIERVEQWLQRDFPTFVLKEVVYKMVDKRVRRTTQRVIPGLLFVQGHHMDIRAKLLEMASDLYLVKDCMTGRVAEIPDTIMRSFMQITTISSTRIRFMPHNIGYYSAGNPLVRVTSGALKGMEGYRIRIARNRCLVTSLGGMSIAISGVHKDSFENVEEYLRVRKSETGQADTPAQHKEGLACPATWQDELNALLFMPETALDILTLAGKCGEYVPKIDSLAAQGYHTDALGAAIYLLEEIGCRFVDVDEHEMRAPLAELQEVVDALAACLQRVRAKASLSDELALTLQAQVDSVRLRFPFLQLSL